MSRVPLAIVGVGKIARDQHVPALAASPDLRLAAAVSLDPVDIGVPWFPTIAAMMAAIPEVAAVSICTPPIGRLALVREALAHRCHVLIEKPPAASLGDAELIVSLAAAAGRTLFTAWHSREAGAVAPARAWLAAHPPRSITVDWLEDVRVWHPGQEWIWEPGIGIFDPGVNAFSILTAILGPLSLREARLRTPVNRAAPISAELRLDTLAGAPVAMRLAFDHPGEPCWSIRAVTDAGDLALEGGGTRLSIDGIAQPVDQDNEYVRLYRRFAAVLAAGASDVDLAPFRLVADSFLRARHAPAPAFDW